MQPARILAAALTLTLPLLPSSAAQSASTVASAESSLIEAWGRIVAQESNADKFDLDETGRASLIKGLDSGIAQKPAPHPLDNIYTDVAQFVEIRTAEFRRRQREQNLAVVPAYFETLKKKRGVVALPSSVCYEVLVAGEGASPRADQTVTVKYRARLIDGTEFDSTDQFGAVDIVLGRIIAGWSEGIQTMHVGGKIRLVVPPALAFNDTDSAMMNIPPGSIIDAEIELLAIKDTPPEEAPPPPPPIPPPPAPAGFSEAEIIETWGWLISQERGVAQADLTADERAQFLAGFAVALTKRPAAIDEKQRYPQVAQFVSARHQVRENGIRQKRREENEAFFAGVKKNPAVVSLPDGLCYEIVKPGEGASPKNGQRVRVNYTGTLIDGTVFDRTDPELGPLEVDVGRVIPGWSEGIQKIATNGRIKLYIPPELAYGDVATGGIPAGAALIFEIELLKVSEIPVN
ncbi:MAG: FKBP-type peptidyl-prolyl cis-trans isomerase [Nibricoccus sp.]